MINNKKKKEKKEDDKNQRRGEKTIQYTSPYFW
jgi:hypothetical protein